jgi:transcriptional regulator with XRE-family HTH domain
VAQSRRKEVQPPPGLEKAFGRALREIRLSRGISQERLAIDAGCDRTFPSLVERGLRSPTIRSLVRLADALEVRPHEIVLRMEDYLPKRRRAAR